jgi:hypothetical protein
MAYNEHPDDQPPEQEFVIADEDAAVADMGEVGLDNPVSVGAAFLTAVTHKRGPIVGFLLDVIVTPESRHAWGDFAEVAEDLRGCGMTSRANPAVSDEDVVYVKYVSDPGVTLRATTDVVMNVRAVATLVRRPGLGGWRVHAVGDYLRPEEVPRD